MPSNLDGPNLEPANLDAARTSAQPDERFMARAIDLAERGRGTTSPNPLVGCVLVAHGEIVAEGFHRRAGEAHAETIALQAAGDAARGATAYLTLEPCDHHGRTPPCSLALISAGVRRVVLALRDPDPRVDGRGVRRLRDAGIEVTEGVLEDAARTQNEAFLTAQREGRPFVTYKTAMTLDGKIATRSGHARWVSDEPSRTHAHRLRHEVDAVAVGIRTVLHDDPRLTTRLPDGRTPLKIVFDRTARTPTDAALFDPSPDGVPARVLIVLGPDAPPERRVALHRAGCDLIELDGPAGEPPSVDEALARLHEREVRSLLLEGGGTLAWSFLAARAIDRVVWFVAPKLIGGSGPGPLGGAGVDAMDQATHLDDVHVERSGVDLCVTGRPRYPSATEAG
ncbi:MAG: bifunctional diaminohydroxyphosphoribosylaminopyrimidine deaminase/5-amino-6-(5-phosphoribosylamino)uracil reductase RibD [Trueperaceae bacterium]